MGSELKTKAAYSVVPIMIIALPSSLTAYGRDIQAARKETLRRNHLGSISASRGYPSRRRLSCPITSFRSTNQMHAGNRRQRTHPRTRPLKPHSSFLAFQAAHACTAVYSFVQPCPVPTLSSMGLLTNRRVAAQNL